jgi:hypothetical protein
MDAPTKEEILTTTTKTCRYAKCSAGRRQKLQGQDGIFPRCQNIRYCDAVSNIKVLGQHHQQHFGFEASRLNGLGSSVAERNGKSFTVSLSRAARAGETLTLALDGALANRFKVNLNGNDEVNANGAVMALAEGQTLATFTLVGGTGVDSNLAGALSVSYQGVSGNNTLSNRWGLALTDTSGDSDLFTMVGGVRTQAVEYSGWSQFGGGYETRILPPGEGDYLGLGSQSGESFYGGSYSNLYTGFRLQGLGGNDVLLGFDHTDESAMTSDEECFA